jgi:hypothetical protein
MLYSLLLVVIASYLGQAYIPGAAIGCGRLLASGREPIVNFRRFDGAQLNDCNIKYISALYSSTYDQRGNNVTGAFGESPHFQSPRLRHRCDR